MVIVIALLALVAVFVAARAWGDGLRGERYAQVQWLRDRVLGPRAPEPAVDGFTLVEVEHDGRARHYYYYIPDAATDQPPLVIGLHGGGGNAQDFGRRTRIKKMAEKYGYIIVLPQGAGSGGRRGSWNANSTVGLDYAEKNQVDDVGFVAAILDQMAVTVAYDTARVYATGMSKGGMMAYYLACRIPERLAAIAPVAGTLSAQSCDPGTTGVALLHIHGTKDENVPWKGGAGKLSRRGANWPAVQPGIDLFSRANQCDMNTTSQRIAKDVVCMTRSCKSRYSVEVCVVEGGGHAWPGTLPARWQRRTNTYVSPHFDATDYIGAFFARHARG